MDNDLTRAAGRLKMGGVILYPTDTIWGIGCDATHAGAVSRIYEIKKRSDSKSMLVLMDGIRMLEDYLRTVPERTEEILSSLTRPTTIIYPGAINLAPNLLAEDCSIGIRVTSDPFCRRLIEMAGVPLVSTSANSSGHPPPGLFHEIEPEILEAVDYVVAYRQDDNSTSAPSSIIRISEQGDIRVIRP
jgi:L-threonylcarbamoyladenylate synthase